MPVTYRSDCPSRTVIEVIANKWALYVLAALRRYERPLRFNELRRVLDGITQKMLTQTLRALERDGLVSRTVYPTVPPRVEYGLTPLASRSANSPPPSPTGHWNTRAKSSPPAPRSTNGRPPNRPLSASSAFKEQTLMDTACVHHWPTRDT
ncbi:helix-turn-helix domain-containing protein [Streptomyces sp. FXJ1.4098]|nr:helix-turn-helix domain-containing protein [Streptomyces sp. FXJ1.4098]